MNGTWKDEYFVKILETQNITHDVKRFRVSKPSGYQFIPGEATDIVIDKPEWKSHRKPFTFTGLNDWDFLEFTIKIYERHQGMTHRLNQLRLGDELILHDSFGAFRYRGPGVFIAGGAGVTPFIAILRQLQKENRLDDNRLFCSNKTVKDIILKDEFEAMMGDHFINTLTREKTPPYDNRSIDRTFLKEKIHQFDSHFYLCGPDTMTKEIRKNLLELGADSDRVILEEEFAKIMPE